MSSSNTTARRQCIGSFCGVLVGAAVLAVTLPFMHTPASAPPFEAKTVRGHAAVVSVSPLPSACPSIAPVTGLGASLRMYEPAGHEHLVSKAFDPMHLAPLAHEAQEHIYKHQHPEDCQSSLFLVSWGHVKGNGIGSIMHVSGSHLSGALESGRVFVWGAETGSEWTDPTTCGTVKNFECHFRAPTSCTLQHVTKENHIIAEMHYGAAGVPPNHVPTVFSRRLQELYPHMQTDEMKYWWRGQSVAYLMRMNNAAVDAVRKMRYDNALHTIISPHASVQAALKNVPLPPGSIHAHVRHGDKYTEMLLQPTSRYFNASTALVRDFPMVLRRTLFVSTEDETVLQDAAAYANVWSILYTNIPRSNAGPLQQVNNLGTDRAGYTARTHLLQLLMSLEADAWITTRGSNWNRLIDELRCIWVDKCKAPIAEVGTPESWENYNW